MKRLATNSRHRLSIQHQGQEVPISTRVRPKSDDLIVFMHGLGCAKEGFAAAFEVEQLREFSLCTFDFPGHGESGALDSRSYSLETYADIARAVIERLAPERVFMVCHSMGGAVGLIATQGIRNLECFVSVEGNLVPEDCGLISRETAAGSLDDFVARGFHSFVADLESSSREDLRAWARWYAACEPPAIHEIARSLVEWSDSNKLIELFNSLERRAYVYGEEDGRLDHLLPKLSETPTYPIAGSGHFPMVDNPVAFYAVLGEVCTSRRSAVSAQNVNASSWLQYTSDETADVYVDPR